MITRREFLASALLMVGMRSRPASGRPGQLRARPGRLSATSQPGRYSLGLAAGRDGLLYVPTGYQADRRVPLFVMLHGAGGQAKISESLAKLADEYETVILAPDSRGRTWDAVLGQMGPDVAFIDAALAHVFARCAVDPGRLAIAGFSDGASYALSLGTINGDLFTHVIGFSPGFVVRGTRSGWPRIFISHGTRDEVLPIDRTSRRIVPELEESGYRVTYREFDGPHAVPPATIRDAFEWLTRGQRPSAP